MKKDRIYLIDFDGTITKEDTLTEIALSFYPKEAEEWWKKLQSGEYSIKNWLDSFKDRFDIEKNIYTEFLKKLSIDESFEKFISTREARVVSGGFDYNIERIFEKYRLSNIKVYANLFKFISENRINIEMNYFNEKCGKCGVCKKNILEKYREEYNEIIFIGDGITDICAARFSDKIYAKKDSWLEKKLQEEGREYVAFKTFAEVD